MLLGARGPPSSGEGVVNPLLAVAEANSGGNVQPAKAAKPPWQVGSGTSRDFPAKPFLLLPQIYSEQLSQVALEVYLGGGLQVTKLGQRGPTGQRSP